ncbi:unnamed protein product [Camellia sinensis]
MRDGRYCGPMQCRFARDGRCCCTAATTARLCGAILTKLKAKISVLCIRSKQRAPHTAALPPIPCGPATRHVKSWTLKHVLALLFSLRLECNFIFGSGFGPVHDWTGGLDRIAGSVEVHHGFCFENLNQSM